jgi:hypothetical protein
LVQAYQWFELCYELGGKKSKPLLFEMMNNKVLTTNQLAEADRMINDFKARHNRGTNGYGTLYHLGTPK